MFEYKPIMKPFYDGLEEGKFLGRKCKECGHVEFPPYAACNECGNYEGNEWIDLADEDVTVDEIYKISPMMTTQAFMPYAPVFACEAHMNYGIEFTCMVFGVTKKTYKTIREQVPLTGKLVTLPMDGFLTFGVSINGVMPKRKEDAGERIAMADVLSSISKHTTDENSPLTGKYSFKLEMLGREREGTMALIEEQGKLRGVINAMDQEAPLSGELKENNHLSYKMSLSGVELEFEADMNEDGTFTGYAMFGDMRMELSGERIEA